YKAGFKYVNGRLTIGVGAERKDILIAGDSALSGINRIHVASGLHGYVSEFEFGKETESSALVAFENGLSEQQVQMDAEGKASLLIQSTGRQVSLWRTV